jgi:hypothetical protein
MIDSLDYNDYEVKDFVEEAFKVIFKKKNKTGIEETKNKKEDKLKKETWIEQIKRVKQEEEAKMRGFEEERKRQEKSKYTVDESGNIVPRTQEEKKKESKKDFTPEGEHFKAGDKVKFLNKEGKMVEGVVKSHNTGKRGEYVFIKYGDKIFARLPKRILRPGQEPQKEEVKKVEAKKIETSEGKEEGTKKEGKFDLKHLIKNPPAFVKDKGVWVKAVTHLTKGGKKANYASAISVYKNKLKQKK